MRRKPVLPSFACSFMNVLRFAITLLIVTLPAAVWAKPLAFPGAAGFGRHALGARGGSDPDVYIVDRLSDDGEPGTLRHAIDSVVADHGRFIVFAVGGVITLQENRPLEIDSPFITLAGQTAPQGGICILGEGLFVTSHDIIIRGLRVRPSDYHSVSYQATQSRDGLKVGEGTETQTAITDIIIDHCSFSWSTDEIVSAYRACRNVTYQANIFSEALHKSIHWDEGAEPWVNEPHSHGPTIGPWAHNISLFRNVSAHTRGRNPMLKGTDQVEVINNVFYNFGFQGVFFTDPEGGRGLKANVIGNQWIGGPDSVSDRARLIEFHGLTATKGSAVHLAGNVADMPGGHLAATDDPVAAGFYRSRGGTNLGAVLKPQPVFVGIPNHAITAMSAAEDELDAVIDDAGARWPMRDAIDRRVIDHIELRSGSHVDVVYQTPGSRVGQWVEPVGTREALDVDRSGDPKLPDYATLGDPAPIDADRDGIPDSLESTYGSNPLADDDGDGYLNIEAYLNAIIAAK